jgi:hypothetical protein
VVGEGSAITVLLPTGYLEMKKALPLISAATLGLVLAAFILVRGSQGFAWDYSINWTAALGSRLGFSLYDRDALRLVGEAEVGPIMGDLFTHQFTSYIGLPTTALALVPFTALDFTGSLLIYRTLAALAFVGGVAIAGFAAPPGARTVAWAAGGLGLLCWHSVVFSLELGQVDAWIVLCLAISVYAASRKRWALCGVGIGIATLLKVSPGLILLYGLLKRQWSLVWSAALTMLGGLLLALVPQRGGDLVRFLVEIAPSVGDGSIHVQNRPLARGWRDSPRPTPRSSIFQSGSGCGAMLVWPLRSGCCSRCSGRGGGGL